jgi:putative hydrolase of the HAD superfamily
VSVRAVLFDLDDTLLDYTGAVEACWTAACAHGVRAGVDPGALADKVHEVRRWFWADPERHRRERTSMVRAWTKIADRALADLGAASPALAATIAEDFASRRERGARLFDDARPCLDALRGRRIPLGLVTNGDAAMQRAKLARHQLEHDFDVVVIEGEFGTGKPDPRVYRHALEALGIQASDTVMIGDNYEWDVAGALAVGIGGIFIDRAGKGVPAKTTVRPTRVIDTLALLSDLDLA